MVSVSVFVQDFFFRFGFEMGFDEETGALLDFTVNFADVAADDAEAEHLQTAEQPDGRDDGCPARDGDAAQVRDERVQEAEDAEDGDENAEVGDEL